MTCTLKSYLSNLRVSDNSDYITCNDDNDNNNNNDNNDNNNNNDNTGGDINEQELAEDFTLASLISGEAKIIIDKTKLRALLELLIVGNFDI
jgi:hypothetical protein